MLSKRGRVLVAAVVALAAASAVWFLWERNRSVPLPVAQTGTQTVRSPEEVAREWRDGVDAAAAAFAKDGDAVHARDALLRLTVPADGRETHLALILALEAARQQRPDAATRWEEALAQFRR